MTDKMERASTGSPPGLAMTTGIGALAAACTSREAGRACSPTEDPTVT